MQYKFRRPYLNLLMIFPGTLRNYCYLLNLGTSTSYLDMHYITTLDVTGILSLFSCTFGMNKKTGSTKE
jgi:hypothetical protein